MLEHAKGEAPNEMINTWMDTFEEWEPYSVIYASGEGGEVKWVWSGECGETLVGAA